MSTTTTTTRSPSPSSTTPAVTTPPPSSSSTTTTSTTPASTTTTTRSSSTTKTSSPSSTTTTADTRTSNPSTPTSNGNSSETSASSTTPGSSSAVPTLQVPVTSVGETTAIGTSNGVVYTQTLSVTTIITSGIAASADRTSNGSEINIGAIVGGSVGGAAVLVILALLIFFCLRKRSKDEFDGNFDPVHVNGKGGLGGSGTLPSIYLGEEDHIMSDGGRVRGADEDDGMGRRLGSGVGGGGIIMPDAFKPTTPIGGQRYQTRELPQTQQMGNIGVAAGGVGASVYENEKRAMRQYSQTPNSNNLYATSSPPHSYLASPSINSNPSYAPSSYLNMSVSPEPYASGATSDGSSSVGGGAYYQQQQQHFEAMRVMGPSRGPSSSSGNSGGRNAKEVEAMGRVVVNPDGGGASQGQQGQYAPQQGPQQYGQFQAYLQNGPGPYYHHQQQQQHQHQQQYHHLPSSSEASEPLQDQQTSSARPGTAVVVHEDGGRVVLHKAAGAEEGEVETISPEIPPTYDSLPVDVRRDG